MVRDEQSERRVDRDRYGRTLGYLELDGTDMGRQMIADGYAVELTIGTPHDRARDYAAAQSAAQVAGAWTTCPPW